MPYNIYWMPRVLCENVVFVDSYCILYADKANKMMMTVFL